MTFKAYHPVIWKDTQEISKEYPLSTQSLSKLSGLSAQVPDAFKKRISTPRHRKLVRPYTHLDTLKKLKLPSLFEEICTRFMLPAYIE